MSSYINLSGKKFNNLSVGNRAENRNGRVYFNCLCDCGNSCVIMSKHLISGHTKSCGCLKLDTGELNRTHNMTNTAEYYAWGKMIQRCTNPKDSSWKNYGGRGITVCSEWRNSFEQFFADMGSKPEGDYAIDRTNNSLGYNKNNCKWVTRLANNNNARSNVKVTARGMTLNVSQWSRLTGIPAPTLYGRVNKGLNGEDVIKK